MRRSTQAMMMFVIWMLLVSFQVSGQTKDLSMEQIKEFGYIDWLNQKVYANGIGLAPKEMENQTQAKSMAYRAAVVVAQRNLLEVIKGVHIDSETILEDRIVANDRIVSEIEGIVKFGQVESSQLLENNAVSVLVSVPLTGQMRKVLVHAIEGAGKTPPMISQSQNVMERLLHLENRVTTLEKKLLNLNEVSVEQKSVIRLLSYLIEAWQQDHSHKSGILPVGFASDEETAALGHQINEQNKQMASLFVNLKDLSRRLTVLENRIITKEVSPPPIAKDKAYPYTGLIVDARDTGFKPSLRPELYHQGNLIYPGSYLDLSEAVRSGYVRYFNSRYQAQQSERMGPLPFATKATGTAGGDRGLSIDNEAFKILSAVLQDPNNFLARCRVVIIF